MHKAAFYACGMSSFACLTYFHFFEENPLTHKKQFFLWRTSFDVRIGKFVSDQQKLAFTRANVVVSQHSQTHKVVFDVATELMRHFPKGEKRNWNVTVVQDKIPNAFVMPDGSIFVTTKLIELANTSDELAFVLAHEIGHVYLRHSAHALSTVVSISALLSFCQFILFGESYSIVEQLQHILLSLPMSRQHELEADKFGMKLSLDTGFDYGKGPAILTKLQTLSPGEIPWLSTHPATGDRIKELKIEEMRLKDETWLEEQEDKKEKFVRLDDLLRKSKIEITKDPGKLKVKSTTQN